MVFTLELLLSLVRLRKISPMMYAKSSVCYPRLEATCTWMACCRSSWAVSEAMWIRMPVKMVLCARVVWRCGPEWRRLALSWQPEVPSPRYVPAFTLGAML